MTLRPALVIAAMAVLLSSCGAEFTGPGIPKCTEPGGEISTATIMQVQAVPTAEWGPCIDELKVGWEYRDQFAEAGRAVFWIDSDRVGMHFVEIELARSCPRGGGEPMGNPEPDIERSVLVTEEPGELPVAVVPVAARHVGDARALATRAIGRKIKGRILTPFVLDSEEPASDRILEALRTVGYALVLDDAQVSSDTVELRRARGPSKVGISLDDALDEIAGDLGEPAYRAEWIHRFDGGCIIYRFDAVGAGAETIGPEVVDAIGFYPLGELREAARQAGYDV